MNKKGFTLVELLAVIAILAILVVIALPNVLEMFNTAKENSFKTEVKEIFKVAESQWTEDSLSKTDVRSYSRCKNGCSKGLDLTGRSDFEYYIELSKAGDVVKYCATDGTFQYYYEGNGLKIKEIKNVSRLAKMTSGKITINDNKCKKEVILPPSDNFLMAASNIDETHNYLRTTIAKKDIEKITFTNSIEGHGANGTDCWDLSKGNNGSVLGWSTDVDNNGLYEFTIGSNGGVFASDGSYLFYRLINVTELNGMQYFDTSQITSMHFMFAGLAKITNIDLSNIDTSKVTNMRGVFNAYENEYYHAGRNDNGNGFYGTSKIDYISNLTSLDLSNFNTSNVTDMSEMFEGLSKLTSLDVSNFDTKNVTYMRAMFSGMWGLTTLDLSNFNTSKVTSMYSMFSILNHGNCTAECGVRINGDDDTYYYFLFGSANNTPRRYPAMNLRTIYVGPNFDTSAVTDSHNMFMGLDNIVGGNGTVYNSSKTEKEYAHIDGGNSNPGYFSSKN